MLCLGIADSGIDLYKVATLPTLSILFQVSLPSDICQVFIKSGIIRAFYVLVKDNVDKLGHLEGTKVLFCDLQHTTLASDRGAKHTICLSVIDQVHGYHIKDCPPDFPDGARSN